MDIGSFAKIEGDSIDLRADVNDLDAKAKAAAKAYSVIFFSVATAFANALVQVLSDAKVNVGANAQITGYQGVDMEALHRGINITRDAWHLAVALIPPQNAFAEGTVDLDSTVDTIEPGFDLIRRSFAFKE